MLLLYAAIAAWLLAWAVGAVGVFRRRDFGLGAKALWLAILLVLPIVGLFVWFLWQAGNPDRGQR
jgi:hypothetical protein